MNLDQAVQMWDAEPGWLNTASYGIPPEPAFEALQSALAEWRRGANGWDKWDRSTGRARTAFARLVGVPSDDVAVGASASQVLAPVAASLPSGSRVVVPDIEQTSNLFPWLVHDLDVRTVPPADLPHAIDERTDAVAFSLVQSATGEVAAGGEVVAAARAHGALVVADATQAVGWLPVDATSFDVLAVSAYKWPASARSTTTTSGWPTASGPAGSGGLPPLHDRCRRGRRHRSGGLNRSAACRSWWKAFPLAGPVWSGQRGEGGHRRERGVVRQVRCPGVAGRWSSGREPAWFSHSGAVEDPRPPCCPAAAARLLSPRPASARRASRTPTTRKRPSATAASRTMMLPRPWKNDSCSAIRRV
ncbi:aminotransferase class V-fold PLP-dependent enzyme [Actinomadura darangshiensis]|uniref:Aminotransferase class V-fold PLP-dependent enzyme n=1 Tax=Actinomadura darangshiensis TaxID=705336 RepID=A0A4R5AU94_9ACTN|nr:aminotransferase class V-fold PLP-dependent enzyme [Actinomadura darangshiensis]